MIVHIQTNEPFNDNIDQFSKIASDKNVNILKIFKKNGFGLLHSRKGELIPPSFYNINQIQQDVHVAYVAEKYIEEADFYVVIYYDSDGQVIFKHAMEAKHYQSMACETD